MTRRLRVLGGEGNRMTRGASERIRALLEALYSESPVSGLTHSFYRYPARFSPQFARTAIEAFTQPGDTVFDPFMGGGTTVVEALALGRCVTQQHVAAASDQTSIRWRSFWLGRRRRQSRRPMPETFRHGVTALLDRSICIQITPPTTSGHLTSETCPGGCVRHWRWPWIPSRISLRRGNATLPALPLTDALLGKYSTTV